MFATRAFSESVLDGGRRRLRPAQLGSRWTAGFDRVRRCLTTRWKQGCGGAGRQHGETTRDWRRATTGDGRRTWARRGHGSRRDRVTGGGDHGINFCRGTTPPFVRVIDFFSVELLLQLLRDWWFDLPCCPWISLHVAWGRGRGRACEGRRASKVSERAISRVNDSLINVLVVEIYTHNSVKNSYEINKKRTAERDPWHWIFWWSYILD
jgi:hypothetical protein